MRVLWAVVVLGCSSTEVKPDAGGPDPLPAPDGGQPPSVEPYRAAARPALARVFERCAVLEGVAGGADTPRFTNAELRRAQAATALLDDALAVFDGPGEATALEATFGPTPWRGGARRGTVRRLGDGGFAFNVAVGLGTPSALLVRGTRHADALELVLDVRGARDAGLGLGDGRLALALGPEQDWHASSAVVAELRGPTELAPTSSIVSCATRDGGLTVAAVSTRGVLDADRFPDTFAGATWWSPEGGRAEAVVSNGVRPTIAGRLVECWNERGERRLRAASDGTTTVVEPADAGLARCPAPFDRLTLDAPPLEARVERLIRAAYDGLHRPLVFERRPHRVLWVGAHPDDESFYAAPLLGALCRDLAGACTLVVANDGATGSCRVPAGCPPDLGTFRRAEMARAAAVLGASVVQLDWPPGPFPSETAIDLDRWATAKGGAAALTAALRAVIDRVDPEVVITFDPRHGASCHAEHRVVAALTMSALRESGKTPRVLFSEGLSAPPRFLDEQLLMFDATAASASTGADAWAFVGLSLAEHPSQITPSDVAAYGRTPASGRRVYLLDGSELRADLRYQVCANP